MKRRNRKIVLMLIVLVTTLAMLASCTPATTPSTGVSAPAATTPAATAEKQKVVAYTTMGFSSPYWVEVANGVEDACKDLGYRSIIHDAKGDVASQIAAMESFIQQDVDFIVLSALDSAALKPYVKQALDAGIGVIGQATIVEGQLCHEGPDQADMGTACGEAAGQWCAANWTDGRKLTGVTYFVQADPPTIERERAARAGFEKYFPNIEWVNELGTINSLTLDDGMRNMEALLQSHPDVDVILSACDDGLIGSYEVAKSNNMDLPNMMFAGVNGLPQTLEMMKREKDSGTGAYRVTVDINGYASGRECVTIAQSYFNGETLLDDYFVPAKAVTFDTIDSYFNADGTINFGSEAYRKEHYTS